MNILVFSWRGPGHPLAGGAEQVDHEHHKGWIAAGHSVTLFTSSFPNSKSNEEIDGVRVIRKGSQYVTCHMAAFWWYVTNNHNDYDLVVDEFHGWPFFTPLYVRKPKLAIIQEVTREVWFKYPLPLGLNYLLGMIGFLFEPIFFLPYRRIKFMIGSKSAKKDVMKMGILKKNITIVPHGIILNIPKELPKREKRKTITLLGALAKDKGIEDAICAFGIINKSKDYQFWIVGKSDEKYLLYLKQLVKENKIEDKVTFFGFVDQEVKFKLLARSHLLLNPSIREGWGLVNIEANSVGTPIVSYSSPGLTDSVRNGESGIIVNKNTPIDLANNVVKILMDEKWYRQLVEGSIAWSKNFTWEKSRKASLQLIEKI